MFNNKTSPGYSRPPTSQEAVLGEIRRAIMSRELQPGERVRQEQLAERLNVSRVPVREALKVLEAEGQVTYQAHRGYTVVALSLEELEEIYLARSLLEKEMTCRAVPKVDAGLIRHLILALIVMGFVSIHADRLRGEKPGRDGRADSTGAQRPVPRLARAPLAAIAG